MYVPDDDNYIVDGENYAPPRPPKEDNKKKNSKTKQIIILIVVAIVLGLLVYFISSLFFHTGNNSGEPSGGLSTTLSVDDPEVESIYEMVTYGRDTNNLNKFLREQSVMLRDFSNYEKYYYALSLLRSRDLNPVEEEEEEVSNQYTIEDAAIDEMMKSYFGDDVSYLKQGTLSITLGHSLEEGNSLSLTYNVTDEQYEVTLQTTTPDSSRLIPVALYGLESASRDEDGTITLVERVVYLTSDVANNTVGYQIYRDASHTMLITSQENIPLEEYQKNPITIEDYMDQGNIVTYQFREDNGEYYFYRSTIEQ
jgi:hypothetical protein